MLLRARGREIIAHTSIGRDKLDCPLSLRVLHVRVCCVALVVSRGKKTNPPPPPIFEPQSKLKIYFRI